MLFWDRAAAFVLLGFGGYVIVAALRMSYMQGRVPGPGFAPFWIGLGLMVVAAAILVGMRKTGASSPLGDAAAGSTPADERGPATAAEPQEPPRETPALPARTTAAIAAVIVTGVALIAPLGMRVALALLLLAMTRILGASWRTAVAAAIGIPVALHLIFGAWLGVPLPRGPWGF